MFLQNKECFDWWGLLESASAQFDSSRAISRIDFVQTWMFCQLDHVLMFQPNFLQRMRRNGHVVAYFRSEI